jgi:hypothetical protein
MSTQRHRRAARRTAAVRRTAVAVLAVVALTLGGCSDNTRTPAAGGSGESDSPSASAPALGPTGSVSVPGPGGAGPTGSASGPTGSAPGPTGSAPGPAVGEVSVTGSVADGVEPGCRVLRAPDREYLLVVPSAADFALRAGTRVTVTGRLRPDMATTCMQGIPLVVTAVRPA